MDLLARSVADDGDALSPPCELVIEEATDELERDVLEREGGTVEELEQPQVVAEVAQGDDVRRVEGGVGIDDETDELAGLMLTILLRRAGANADPLSSSMLASERIDRLAALDPQAVCVGALPPYAAFHARHLIKRIRARLPKIEIIVGYWDPAGPPAQINPRLKAAGADRVVRSFKEALEALSTAHQRPSHATAT